MAERLLLTDPREKRAAHLTASTGREEPSRTRKLNQDEEE
jgi:hypothetical protein